MRTREGVEVARAKGHLKGRKPELTTRQEAHLVALAVAGEHTTAEIAELFGVARSPVHRALERAGVHPGDRDHPLTTEPEAAGTTAA